MTNQEAIRLIRNHPTMCEFPDAYGKPYYEAVDMAISALEEQELKQELKQEVKNSNESSSTHKALDTISRTAAISELMEWVEKEEKKSWSTFKGLFHWTGIKAMLECLPSAQPEIVRCKDCKHHWTHRCMDSMPTEICDLNQTFYDPNIDFCSLAERRTDE